MKRCTDCKRDDIIKTWDCNDLPGLIDFLRDHCFENHGRIWCSSHWIKFDTGGCSENEQMLLMIFENKKLMKNYHIPTDRRVERFWKHSRRIEKTED